MGRAQAVALDGEREPAGAGDGGGGVGPADLAAVDVGDERVELAGQERGVRAGEFECDGVAGLPDHPADADRRAVVHAVLEGVVQTGGAKRMLDLRHGAVGSDAAGHA